MDALLRKHYDCKQTACIGFGPSDNREALMLNRIIRCVPGNIQSENVLEFEGDRRHADVIVEQLGIATGRGIRARPRRSAALSASAAAPGSTASARRSRTCSPRRTATSSPGSAPTPSSTRSRATTAAWSARPASWRRSFASFRGREIGRFPEPRIRRRCKHQRESGAPLSACRRNHGCNRHCDGKSEFVIFECWDCCWYLDVAQWYVNWMLMWCVSLGRLGQLW